MNRIVIFAIIKICGEACLLTLIVGGVIGVIGYLKKWDTTIAYSNAFFLAGCLAIAAGASSRFAAGQGWRSFQLLQAESFRNMGSSERANFIIEVSSPARLVILGVLSGILLIFISVFVMKIF